MSSVHWAMKKQLPQVMVRNVWQMCFPANQDVFNIQELLLCTATDIKLGGTLQFTRGNYCGTCVVSVPTGNYCGTCVVSVLTGNYCSKCFLVQ